MHRVAAIRRALDGLSSRLTLLGGYVLLAASLLVCTDVVIRRLFAVSVGGADEISGYALALATGWASSYTLFRRAHIRVDVVYRQFSGTVKAWLDVVSLLAMLAFSSLLAFYGTIELIEALTFGALANTQLRTPLWLPLSFWVSGLLLFFGASLVLLVESVLRAVSGDHEGVRRIAGVSDDNEAAIT